jgi:hypothetical protein
MYGMQCYQKQHFHEFFYPGAPAPAPAPTAAELSTAAIAAGFEPAGVMPGPVPARTRQHSNPRVCGFPATSGGFDDSTEGVSSFVDIADSDDDDDADAHFATNTFELKSSGGAETTSVKRKRDDTEAQPANKKCCQQKADDFLQNRAVARAEAYEAEAAEAIVHVEPALVWLEPRATPQVDLVEERGWACTKCTFINLHSTYLQCETCNAHRPPPSTRTCGAGDGQGHGAACA